MNPGRQDKTYLRNPRPLNQKCKDACCQEVSDVSEQRTILEKAFTDHSQLLMLQSLPLSFNRIVMKQNTAKHINCMKQNNCCRE